MDLPHFFIWKNMIYLGNVWINLVVTSTDPTHTLITITNNRFYCTLWTPTGAQSLTVGASLVYWPVCSLANQVLWVQFNSGADLTPTPPTPQKKIKNYSSQSDPVKIWYQEKQTRKVKMVGMILTTSPMDCWLVYNNMGTGTICLKMWEKPFDWSIMSTSTIYLKM